MSRRAAPADADADPPPPGWLERIAEAAPELWRAAATPQEALSHEGAAIRLGAALLFGAIIGLDRERKERPAGLRTHMLVSLAAALFTVSAVEIAASGDRLGPSLRVDPTRVVEAVTAGVAFIAAGAIFRAGDRVKGVTTGAAMWLAGALGVASGLGYLSLAGGVALAAMTVLVVLRKVEG